MRLQEERAASELLPQERHGIKGSQPQGTSARAWDDPPSGTNILTQDGSKKLAEEVCVVLHLHQRASHQSTPTRLSLRAVRWWWRLPWLHGTRHAPHHLAASLYSLSALCPHLTKQRGSLWFQHCSPHPSLPWRFLAFSTTGAATPDEQGFLQVTWSCLKRK